MQKIIINIFHKNNKYHNIITIIIKIGAKIIT
jgi:hypothetical protein